MTKHNIDLTDIGTSSIVGVVKDGKIEIVQGLMRAKIALAAGGRPKAMPIGDGRYRITFVSPAKKSTKSEARLALDAEVQSRPGCVTLRRSRATGTMVGLYKSLESGIESDQQWPWSTVCEDHGTVVCHATRKLAEMTLPDPRAWCDECREAPDAKKEKTT